jgi:hypothetical protein
MAKERQEIEAVRQTDAEAQGSLTAVWDDLAKAWRARACDAAKPNDGWQEVTLADIAFLEPQG